MAGNSSNGNDLEQSLLSFERLDRASPDLWPESVPGVSDFMGSTQQETAPPKWLADIEKDDVDMVHEFGSLTTSQLVEKVRGLQELAFQLGLEEEFGSLTTTSRLAEKVRGLEEKVKLMKWYEGNFSTFSPGHRRKLLEERDRA